MPFGDIRAGQLDFLRSRQVYGATNVNTLLIISVVSSGFTQIMSGSVLSHVSCLFAYLRVSR